MRCRQSKLSGVLLTILLAGPSAAEAVAQDFEIAIWGGQLHAAEWTTGIGTCHEECFPSESLHDGSVDFTGGLGFRAELHDRLAVMAGVAFSPKGFGPQEAPADRQVNSRYLEIPIATQLKAVSLGPAALWVELGVAPARLIACRTSGTTISGFEDTACEVPSSATGMRHGPEVRGDLGWLAGSLLRIKTPAGSLHVHGRYTRGMVDIKPNDGGTTTNRSWLVALGFARPLPIF